MSGYTTEVQNLTYNAASQNFEAVVVFHEPGETTKFPCSLAFPIDAEFADVTHGLIAVAKSRRASKLRNLVSRTPAHGTRRLVHIADLARQFADTLGLRDTPRAA
jgi:hypothetical protein